MRSLSLLVNLRVLLPSIYLFGGAPHLVHRSFFLCIELERVSTSHVNTWLVSVLDLLLLDGIVLISKHSDLSVTGFWHQI